MANFLSISPNQAKLLPPVPRLDFSAIPVSIFAVSLGRLSTYTLFKVAKWAIPLRHILQILFEYCKYVYVNIGDSNIP